MNSKKNTYIWLIPRWYIISPNHQFNFYHPFKPAPHAGTLSFWITLAGLINLFQPLTLSLSSWFPHQGCLSQIQHQLSRSMPYASIRRSDICTKSSLMLLCSRAEPKMCMALVCSQTLQPHVCTVTMVETKKWEQPNAH